MGGGFGAHAYVCSILSIRVRLEPTPRPPQPPPSGRGGWSVDIELAVVEEEDVGVGGVWGLGVIAGDGAPEGLNGGGACRGGEGVVLTVDVDPGGEGARGEGLDDDLRSDTQRVTHGEGERWAGWVRRTCGHRGMVVGVRMFGIRRADEG